MIYNICIDNSKMIKDTCYLCQVDTLAHNIYHLEKTKTSKNIERLPTDHNLHFAPLHSATPHNV